MNRIVIVALLSACTRGHAGIELAIEKDQLVMTAIDCDSKAEMKVMSMSVVALPERKVQCEVRPPVGPAKPFSRWAYGSRP